MAVKSLTQHQKDNIVVRFQKDNRPVRQLAFDYGVSARTINRALEEAGSVMNATLRHQQAASNGKVHYGQAVKPYQQA